jgi:hypothetical protein
LAGQTVCDILHQPLLCQCVKSRMRPDADEST